MPALDGPHSFDYIHHTTTGRTYPLQLGYVSCSSDLVPHDRVRTERACQTGCRLYGRNGGCPPYAPLFVRLLPRYDYATVVYVRVDAEHFPSRVLASNFYVRWSFVETVLGNLATRLGLRVQEAVGGFLLSAGHCTRCAPRSCGFKTMSVCVKPSLRTFSMESTGVIVTDLMASVFDMPVHWFDKRDPLVVPPYMMKVFMIVTGSRVPPETTAEVLDRALVV